MAADVIVANKTDLVGAEGIDAAEGFLCGFNADADHLVGESSSGDAALSWALNGENLSC